jgi:uncharacterized membrane protein
LKSNHLRKLILTALFTALTCLATAMISDPAPLVGYVHVGDVLVLCSAFLLGPLWGAVAAGLGSALADVFLAYAIYAPATLVIKAAFAMVAALTARALRSLPVGFGRFLGGVLGGILMALGYFVYEAFALGYGVGAAANIPASLLQAALGIVVSLPLIALVEKTRAKQIFH